jgi:hypothetical protein
MRLVKVFGSWFPPGFLLVGFGLFGNFFPAGFAALEFLPRYAR